MSRPRYIIVSGIDGSGKTSIIEGVRERLEARGHRVLVLWLRFNHLLVKPVHAFCRLVGLSRRRVNSQGQTHWRHEFYRCRPFCDLYRIITYLDTLLARLKVGWQVTRQRPDIVLCDRWVYDILVDLAVDTRRMGWLRGGWLRRFESILPATARPFLIQRRFEDVLAVRPEYRHDPEFLFRACVYKRLEKIPRLTVIHNNRGIEDAVEAILADLEEPQRTVAIPVDR